MAKKLYGIPSGRYDPTFLKALAMAIHTDCVDPAELEYWFDNDWKQEKMAQELYKRIKEAR